MCTAFWSYRSRCLFTLLQLANVSYITELTQPLCFRSSLTFWCAVHYKANAAVVFSTFFNLLMCATFWSYVSRCLINLLQLAIMNYILMLSQLLFLHSSSICKCAQHSWAIAAAVSSLFFNLLMCATFWSYGSRCLFALLQLNNAHYIM
jgi:hypothetical protein